MLPVCPSWRTVCWSPPAPRPARRSPGFRSPGPATSRAGVERARAAAAWWADLGFGGRRTRLLQFRSILANRMPELADLLRRECGKPVVDGVVQTAASSPHRLGGAQRAPGPGAAPGPRVNARLGVLRAGDVSAVGCDRRDRTGDRLVDDPGSHAVPVTESKTAPTAAAMARVMPAADRADGWRSPPR